jgi:uncharacterized protein YcbX
VGNIAVGSIFVYPIKSCRAVELRAATVSAIGLAGDRLWQVVDGEQRGMTQRQHPILATVQPSLTDDGGVQVRAPGREPLDVAPPVHPVTTRSHFGLPVPALDAGDQAAEWFSALVGAPSRLVRMAGPGGWRLPGDLDVFGQAAPFSDAAPVLVTADASLEDLRVRASEPFGMDRFRPNLVLTGSAPWAEDTWTDLRVGEAALRVVTPWPRCAIPQIDQQTGERHGEPARVLRALRWCASAPDVTAAWQPILEGNALFGVACSIGPVGAGITVGDAVVVGDRRPPVLAPPSSHAASPAAPATRADPTSRR